MDEGLSVVTHVAQRPCKEQLRIGGLDWVVGYLQRRREAQAEERELVAVPIETPVQEPADDVAQEALVRAWQSLDRFELGRPFGPWVRRFGAVQRQLTRP